MTLLQGFKGVSLIVIFPHGKGRGRFCMAALMTDFLNEMVHLYKTKNLILVT